MMALPDSSTGPPSSRMLAFEPGANGITVFPLRSIITQLLFNHTHVDEHQSIYLLQIPGRPGARRTTDCPQEMLSWTIESLLSVARMSQRSSSKCLQSIIPPVRQRAVSDGFNPLNRSGPHPATMQHNRYSAL